MARGFLSGVFWGGVLSIGLGSVASVVTPLAPQPQSPQVSDTAPGAGQSPQVADSEVASVAGASDDSTPQSSQTGAQTSAPEADNAPTLDETPIASPQIPETEIVAGLAPIQDVPTAGGIALSEVDPVLPNPQALAPMIPQGADGVSIDTEPAQLPAPQVNETVVEPEPVVTEDDAGQVEEQPSVVAEPEPETAVVAEDANEAAQEDVVSEQSQEAASEPTDDANQVAGADAEESVPSEAETAETETAQTETAEAETAQTEAPATETPAAETNEAAAEAEETAPAVEDTQVAVLTPAVRPQIGTPAISLTDREGSVTVNRLGNSAAIEAAQTEEPAAEGAATSSGSDPRPVAAYAQAFENLDDKPMMSIVLIDDGTNPTAGAAGIAALGSFPYALNFAVDSSLPDAKERMALYRAAGFEVLALVDLPEGAQATDVETTFGVTLTQMNEVVGVLEGTGAGLQGAREVSDQVTAVLAQTGHGLVTQAKGLNTMPKLARKEGVPAFPVFRDFDSKDQTATVIRRFLDQAAFKAGQEGAVIMLGRMRPDTITALLLWGLQDRAGQVALAPISAVLTREEG